MWEGEYVCDRIRMRVRERCELEGCVPERRMIKEEDIRSYNWQLPKTLDSLPSGFLLEKQEGLSSKMESTFSFFVIQSARCLFLNPWKKKVGKKHRTYFVFRQQTDRHTPHTKVVSSYFWNKKKRIKKKNGVLGGGAIPKQRCYSSSSTIFMVASSICLL